MNCGPRGPNGSVVEIGPGRKTGSHKSWQRHPIDYATRELFLPATTVAAEWGYGDGAPIDSLRASALPAMLDWKEYAWNEPMGPLVTFLNPAILTFGRIVELSGSDEGQALSTALRKAVAAWMQRHNFQDDWIADRAINTLFCLAINPTEPDRRWTRMNVMGLQDEIRRPTFTASISVPRLRTTNTEYETCEQQIERLDREIERIRQEAKAFKAHLRQLDGATVDHGAADQLSGHRLHACYAAAVIAGATYVQLGDDADGNIRNNVRNFAKRIGLTLPRLSRFGAKRDVQFQQ